MTKYIFVTKCERGKKKEIRTKKLGVFLKPERIVKHPV